MTIRYITDRESFLVEELVKRNLALADTIALCTHLVGQRDKAIQHANEADKRCIELIDINRRLLGVQ